MTLIMVGRRRGNANTGAQPVALAYVDPATSAASYTSNGVPLLRGALTASQLSAGYGRVEVNGTEVPVYIEALFGKHTDGSLRTVLVQCAKTDVQSGTVVFYPDRLRTLSPRTKQTVTRAYIQAPLALLPSSPTYLCATDMCLAPLVPASLLSSISSGINSYYTGLKSRADSYWTANGIVAVPGPGGACYEHGMVYAMLWCMTGESGYWWKAVQIADETVAYATTTDSVANLGDTGYAGAVWSTNLPNVASTLVETMAWAYAATGHPQARQSLAARAAFVSNNLIQTGYDHRIGSLNIVTPEPRTALAHGLMTAWLCVHLEVPSGAYYATNTVDPSAYLGAWLTYLNAALRPATSPGAWLAGVVHSDKDSDMDGTGGADVGIFPTFQLGWSSRALIQTYRYASANANIPTWIASHNAYLRSAIKPVDPAQPAYVAGQRTARYLSVDPSTLGSTIADENDSVLSPMYAMSFAWRAYTANNTTDQTWAEDMLKSVHLVNFGTSYKMLGEQGLYALPAIGYLGLRAGVIT